MSEVSVPDDALLAVRGLRVGFASDEGPGYAVDGISFAVRRGKTLCLVGESGCGKSVTALSILRLLPSPPAIMAGGEIFFDGKDLAKLSESDLRGIRGNRIGMIFQEPMTSLNPVIRVGEQITEGLRLHKGLSEAEAHKTAVGLLEKVGIPFAAERVRDFPHQMSGGMRQRVMIAMALACAPALIIADEPTTALDVTIQKQILALLQSLTAAEDRSLLLITHDLGVVSQVADDVAVMYAGRIVEQGPAHVVLRAPGHPYTRGLMRSRPGVSLTATEASAASTSESRAEAVSKTAGAAPSSSRRLPTIPGTVPGLWSRISGCLFHPRCEYAFDRCRVEEPPFFTLGAGQLSRCWLEGKMGD